MVPEQCAQSRHEGEVRPETQQTHNCHTEMWFDCILQWYQADVLYDTLNCSWKLTVTPNRSSVCLCLCKGIWGFGVHYSHSPAFPLREHENFLPFRSMVTYWDDTERFTRFLSLLHFLFHKSIPVVSFSRLPIFTDLRLFIFSRNGHFNAENQDNLQMNW